MDHSEDDPPLGGHQLVNPTVLYLDLQAHPLGSDRRLLGWTKVYPSPREGTLRLLLLRLLGQSGTVHPADEDQREERGPARRRKRA